MSISDQPSLPDTPPPIDLARLDVGSGGFAFANSEVNLNEDNLKEGYFKLFRSFFENPLWTKPRAFSEAEAWIDILYAVRWKDEPEQIVIGCKLFECNRGESLKSLETWKSRWHWNSRRRVSLFLKLLEKMGQIRITNETVTTRLFVVNYKRYQDYGHANDTGLDTRAERERNASGTRAVTEEEPKKEIKKEPNKESLSVAENPQPSDDAVLIAEKFIKNWTEIYPNIHLKLADQAKAAQLLLNRYKLDDIRWLLNKIYAHGDDRFSWRDQIKSLNKLSLKAKHGSSFNAYRNWFEGLFDYFTKDQT